MSELIVKIVDVDKVDKHPNADRLDIATVGGWQCVIPKDSFKAGDSGLYIPIDSIIPYELECKIFGPESKVKLSKGRIKTIRLRQAISQGLLIRPETAGLDADIAVGTDVATKLDIKKYEPPVRGQNLMRGNATKKVDTNSNFKKYTDIQNVKNYVKVFSESEAVSVTEKIHGTNFRAGYVLRNPKGLWDKFLMKIGAKSKHEFVYGSHNVQLQTKKTPKGVAVNVYLEAVEKYNLKSILRPGEVVYGEVYGSNVQKNYTYGCEEGERKLIIFDLMINGKYQDPDYLRVWCKLNTLPIVPELYRGLFDFQKIKEMLKGNSIICPSQKTIEGGVCKSLDNKDSHIGRKVLKFINDDYLLKDNTDFH